jgi:hypothetical protein
MWIILGCSAGFRDILKILYASALLDIVGEIATRTVFHDKVYVALSALRGLSTGEPNYGKSATYDNIHQFGDVPMGKRLEDVDLALEILDKLGRETTTTDSLDCDFMTRLLKWGCIMNTKVREKLRDNDPLRCNLCRRSRSFPCRGY